MDHNYRKNKNITIGLEMELQIIHPDTHDLCPKAKQLLRMIFNSPIAEYIKPEITQSMIEINSSVHTNPTSLQLELEKIVHFLSQISDELNIHFCGGGTHPFHRWNNAKIFPTYRFKHIKKQYGYLAKQFTIFSMHVHVGCPSSDEAIYLTHHFSRYIPQLITLSASSPFYQGVATGYHSTRVNVVNAFPLSGHIPNLNNWESFTTYYEKMQDLKIISSMKDFYWDIRPKPEFGTVEIRICDMPLSLNKAIDITAYIQTLTKYLLETNNHTSIDLENFYHVYNYNRFQASRFGYMGDFINPFTLQHTTVQNDILNTLHQIKKYAEELNTQPFLRRIKRQTEKSLNDSNRLMAVYKKEQSFEAIVKKTVNLWE